MEELNLVFNGEDIEYRLLVYMNAQAFHMPLYIDGPLHDMPFTVYHTDG